MMPDKELAVAALEKILEIFGRDTVLDAIKTIDETGNDFRIGTIIANKGPHIYPSYVMRGEVFIFSESPLKLDSVENLKVDLSQKLVDLAAYLRAARWKKIYLLISGHCCLSIYIKMLVFRVTGIETVDWIYDSSGGYLDLELSIRGIASHLNKPSSD